VRTSHIVSSGALRGAGRFAATLVFVAVVSSSLFAMGGGEEDSEVVHVYSHRHYDTDRMLFERFEEETGISVEVVEAGADELIQRLEAEGSSTPADLLITVDAGRLYQAAEAELLQPIDSAVVRERLPDHLRSPADEWAALTMRARVVAYHRERADTSVLSTYEALAEPVFSDSIAIRSSSNIYNISLLASLIANLGAPAAEEWAEGMTASRARPPEGNDRDQLRAVAAGDADYAIVNTYYIGRMATSSDAADRAVAAEIGVFFPNQPGVDGSDGRGTHINVSGAGITRHADNPDGARRLIEFLLSDEAQNSFAGANFEYPVVAGIETAPEVAAWGDFVADTLSLEELGARAREASMIFDRVGWQ
jgi:iron(III) transport system substrate-binding protein